MVNPKKVPIELGSKFSAADLDVGFLQTPGKSDKGSLEKTLVFAASEKEIVAAFAYTLSRFTGRSDAVFSSFKNGIYYPHLVGCGNGNVKKFVSAVGKEFREAEALDIKDNKQLPKEFVALREAVVSSEKIPKFKKTSIAFYYELSKKCVKIKIDYSEKIGLNLAERFLKTFENILRGFSEKETLGEIDYSIPEDIVLLEKLHGWKNKLRFGSVLEAFEKTVGEYPERNCVQHKSKRYTFKETDEITDGVASILSASGVKKGDRVAFVVARSEWYIFCFYGIMKTGAAVVPIDEKNPDERISLILSDAKCKAVIVSSETEERVRNTGFGGKIINVSECKKKHFTDAKVSLDDIAAVYYTSGSSGKPKGVMIPHVAFESVAEEGFNAPEITKDQIKGLLSSIGFIINIVFILSTATLVTAIDVMPKEYASDMKKLDEYIKKNKITDILITPRLAKAYFDSVEENTLQLVGFGGEPMCDIEPIKGKRMFIGYGMTESTSSVALSMIEDMMDISSVGMATQNTNIYILDAEMRRVPFGGIGELCVAGMPVAKGYIGDAKMNENFVANPYSGEKYYRNMYKTGDLFRFLPNGSLGFIGRRDGIVKIRGNRVELGEVDSAVRTVPGVRDVAVVPIKNGKGETELCAYVVSDAKIDYSDVEAHVLKSKPDYMVPAFVVRVDKIPLNLNGKVDRKALPKPDVSLLRRKYVAPRNETEKALCLIFSEVLGIKKVGIDDDFVRLGGNSLNAVKVSSAFNSVSEKIRITTLDVLQYHTPRKIVENGKPVSAEKISVDFGKGIPLTASQMNMYTYMTEDKSVETNIVYAISYENWNKEKAYETLLKVIEARPILRSHVVTKNGTLWNSFDGTPEINFYEEEPHALCRRIVRRYEPEDVQSKFSITEWEGKTYLIIDISHLIFDGRSILPLLGSITKAYDGVPLEVDDGLLRQHAYEETVYKSDAYRKHYEKRMSAMKNVDFGDRIPTIPKNEGKYGHCWVPANIVPEELDAAAAAFGTTVGIFASLVFGYTLARFTGRSDAMFHFSQDGRDNVNLENSVGEFVRSTPIVLPYRGEKCGDFVAKNLPKIYELMSGVPIPLHEYRKKYDVWPNTLFQYQHFTKNFDPDPRITIEEIQTGPYFKSVCFLLFTKKDGYTVFCSHTDVHSHDVIENLGKEYARNLREIVGETAKKGTHRVSIVPDT